VVVFGLASESFNRLCREKRRRPDRHRHHGRSGITEWFWGSVAERVLKTSQNPDFDGPPNGCVVDKTKM